MAQDRAAIRLHLKRLPFVRVVEDEIDKLVKRWPTPVAWCAVRRAASRPPRCTRAGASSSKTFRWGRPTTLVWLEQRFERSNCAARHTEDHPEVEGKVTRRLARQLVRDAKFLTIRELSRRHRLGWHPIMNLVRTCATSVGEHGRQSAWPVLLVDETSLRRPHRYVTVLLNGETGEVLGMVRPP